MTKPKEDLFIKHEHNQPFELVLCTRDSKGNVTGRKSFISDRASNIADAWERNRGKPKKKKPKADVNTAKVVKEDGKVQTYTDTSDRVITPEEQEAWNKRKNDSK